MGFKAIAEEIKNQRGLLLENLLDQLKTNLNLSSCLKVVAYLRRLNVFTEAELRIKFLLVNVEKTRSPRKLKKILKTSQNFRNFFEKY